MRWRSTAVHSSGVGASSSTQPVPLRLTTLVPNGLPSHSCKGGGSGRRGQGGGGGLRRKSPVAAEAGGGRRRRRRRRLLASCACMPLHCTHAVGELAVSVVVEGASRHTHLLHALKPLVDHHQVAIADATSRVGCQLLCVQQHGLNWNAASAARCLLIALFHQNRRYRYLSGRYHASSAHLPGQDCATGGAGG